MGKSREGRQPFTPLMRSSKSSDKVPSAKIAKDCSLAVSYVLKYQIQKPVHRRCRT